MSRFRYPHQTIESTGRQLNNHAQSLHSVASGSNTRLPSNSLGSLGSNTAGSLQSHLDRLPGHISNLANQEGQHGSNLINNATNMRNTDQNAARSFTNLMNGGQHGGQLLLTNFSEGGSGVINNKTQVDYHKLPKTAQPPLTQAQQDALDAKRQRLTGQNATSTTNKADNPALFPRDTSHPSAPPQQAPGRVPMPGETYGHTTHGEYKPGNRYKPPSVVGGHVAATDVNGGPPRPTFGRGTPGVVHGSGVVLPRNPPRPRPNTNGVYDVRNVPLAGAPAGQQGNNKPFSTMFPQGVNSGLVRNMGNQAWNHGNPSGGTHLPNDRGPDSTTWQGQAQIPYTPKWQPGSPNHGSGATNPPHAGEIVNIQGFHREMDRRNHPGVQYPATFFPQSPKQQPPVPPVDPNWADNSPPRNYDDPNYPGRP